VSNVWGRFFWRPSRFPGEAAQRGLVAGTKGRFQAEIAGDRLIRDAFGADLGRRRRGVKKLSRSLTRGISCVYVSTAGSDLGRRRQLSRCANRLPARSASGLACAFLFAQDGAVLTPSITFDCVGGDGV
jgi:hypothetical protein